MNYSVADLILDLLLIIYFFSTGIVSGKTVMNLEKHGVVGVLYVLREQYPDLKKKSITKQLKFMILILLVYIFVPVINSMAAWTILKRRNETDI